MRAGRGYNGLQDVSATYFDGTILRGRTVKIVMILRRV